MSKILAQILFFGKFEAILGLNWVNQYFDGLAHGLTWVFKAILRETRMGWVFSSFSKITAEPIRDGRTDTDGKCWPMPNPAN